MDAVGMFSSTETAKFCMAGPMVCQIIQFSGLHQGVFTEHCKHGKRVHTTTHYFKVVYSTCTYNTFLTLHINIFLKKSTF